MHQSIDCTQYWNAGIDDILANMPECSSTRSRDGVILCRRQALADLDDVPADWVKLLPGCQIAL